MHAALVAEDFAGMRVQGRGLAERAGMRWSFHPVRMIQGSVWNHLPAGFWPFPLRSCEPIVLPAETRVVISVGGRGAAVGAALGRLYGLPVVQIQAPRRALKAFALVVANVHDGLSGPNVFAARTTMHDVTDRVLLHARQRWAPVLKPDGRKLLAVLLGGSNGRFRFGEAEIQMIAMRLRAFLQVHPMRCIVIPSRRTPDLAIKALKVLLEPCGVSVMAGEGEANPYHGLLACADCVAVTTDSVSMISEAVATTAPVGVLPLAGRSRRIERFVQTLTEIGRLHPFNVKMPLLPCETFDDTTSAAEEMMRRLRLCLQIV